MLLNKLNKIILALTVTLFLGACATQQKATTTPTDDAYTGTETVKYLADGVPLVRAQHGLFLQGEAYV